MESLFRCTACQHVDMFDLAQSEAQRAQVPFLMHVCTQCLTGHWHQQFPYELYRPETDHVCNPPT